MYITGSFFRGVHTVIRSGIGCRLQYLLVFILVFFATPVMSFTVPQVSPPIISHVFRLAVIGEREGSPSSTLAEMSELHNRLGKLLAVSGIQLAPLVVADNVEQLSAMVARHEIDGFFEGVLTTLAIVRSVPAYQPRLLLWRKGERQYHSVFFVRTESAFQSLADLQGRTIVFESPRSTSAYQLPRMTLEMAGYSLLPAVAMSDSAPAVRSSSLIYRFAGSEENEAYWVDRGLADIGAFNNGDWDRLPDSVRQHLRVIGRSREVPRWLFSMSQNLSVDVHLAVYSALLDMEHTDEGRSALMAASGITAVEALTADDQATLLWWSEAMHGH
jgi:phosphonate transport system substrate-binding protein